jgi:DNA mismatch repair protein MutS
MLALHDPGHHSEVINHLGRALAAELPLYPRYGGFIAAEYLPQLD